MGSIFLGVGSMPSGSGKYFGHDGKYFMELGHHGKFFICTKIVFSVIFSVF